METSKEVALTICEKIQNEYPKRPLWQTMLEIEDLIDKHMTKQLLIHGVVKSFGCGWNFCDAVLSKKGVVSCSKCNRYTQAT
jgi:hypothetical protein